MDDSLTRYVEHLKTADVVGEQLLSLTSEDLHNLQIHLVGHQEQILEAVSLLQQLVRSFWSFFTDKFSIELKNALLVLLKPTYIKCKYY